MTVSVSVEVPSVNRGTSNQRFLITCRTCIRITAVIMINVGWSNIVIIILLSDSEMKIVYKNKAL